MKIQAVKGTRDFYPDLMSFHVWLSKHMREAAELFGYQAWDGPILEPFELYAAKSGDELVNQQSFVFEDRGGRKIVLRPELTPSLARMVAEKQQSLAKPIKWYSVGPMWRYEQPQKGRSREFYQWNVDCLGSNTPLADAEVIAIAISFLQSLGLTEKDVVIKINDRQWFEENIAIPAGIEQRELGKFFNHVDRIDKMEPEAWKTYGSEIGMSSEKMEAIFDKLRAKINPTSLDKSSSLRSVFDTLVSMGFGDYIEINLSIVRGLAYYTGTVFEIRDKDGKLRSIGGGGRYENLVEQVGGEPLSGVGFAIGDMPVEELLQQVEKYPNDLITSTRVLITNTVESDNESGLELATKLRRAGINTELYLPPQSTPATLEKQLKYADQKSIPFVVIFEVANGGKATGKLLLKDMQARNQETLSVEALITRLQS